MFMLHYVCNLKYNKSPFIHKMELSIIGFKIYSSYNSKPLQPIKETAAKAGNRNEKEEEK